MLDCKFLQVVYIMMNARATIEEGKQHIQGG
jgi:hypothetical protein